jgi:NAD(P)H-hydrate epimerase
MPKLLYSRESVQAIDKHVIANGLPGIELMQRAGNAALKILLQYWANPCSVLIYCGFGNNAGDGYILARLLHQKSINVTVIMVGSADKLQGDALTAFHMAQDAKVNMVPFANTQKFQPSLIVDAMFGTGLQRDITGDFYNAIAAINAQQIPVLALDIPSGLDANLGIPLGIAIKATVTITFIAYKVGLFRAAAPEYCGTILLDTLAIPPSSYPNIEPECQI